MLLHPSITFQYSPQIHLVSFWRFLRTRYFLRKLDGKEMEIENGTGDAKSARKVSSERSIDHSHPEYQYIDLVQRILHEGYKKEDRTGTGTLSIFGTQMRFCLRDEIFPLLTTKKMFYRGILEELLWFIRGSTNAKELQAKNVHIWDKNSTREFLDGMGFVDREEGDLGPIYGFQWRHFGAEYKSMNDSYKGKGVDQLTQLIHEIRTNPDSRRLILSAWNVKDIPKMALPPCHCLCQFYVTPLRELCCHMYQRSADMGLGVPFNIASYSLLTIMIAKVTGLKPGELVISYGDAHIYNDHVTALCSQIVRTPYAFPKMKIKRDVAQIEDFKTDDFELLNYQCHPAIKMDMSA